MADPRQRQPGAAGHGPLSGFCKSGSRDRALASGKHVLICSEVTSRQLDGASVVLGSRVHEDLSALLQGLWRSVDACGPPWWLPAARAFPLQSHICRASSVLGCLGGFGDACPASAAGKLTLWTDVNAGRRLPSWHHPAIGHRVIVYTCRQTKRFQPALDFFGTCASRTSRQEDPCDWQSYHSHRCRFGWYVESKKRL